MVFNFDQERVSCESPHVTLAPGDKVTRVRYLRGGAQFHQRAIVRKVNPKRITVEVRFKGNVSGEFRWETETVSKQYLFRYNWQD